MRIDLKTIRERKLVQWTVGYLGACFLVLQLFDVAAEPLGWSGGALITLVVGMTFGLAVVLVLAWYHGEKGRQRVSGVELVIIGSLLGLGGVAVSMVEGPEAGRSRSDGDGVPVSLAAGPILAVLPFDNLSGDPEQAYLAAGMTEILTGAIARIHGIRVISRTSVMGFGEGRPPVPDIARVLGADYLIEGSVLGVGDGAAITAQLIHGATDHHVWANTYEGSLADVMTLIGEAARTIARELEVVLSPEDEGRLAVRGPTNSQAADAVLRARYLMEAPMPENVNQAVRLLEGALDLDPGYATAWGLLAQAQLARTSWFGGAEELRTVMAEAEQAVRRGLAVDSTDIEVQGALADIHLARFEWEAAEAALRRVLEQDPSQMMTEINLVNLLTGMGRWDEAEARARTLLRTAPLSPRPPTELLNVLANMGKPEEIPSLMYQALQLDPTDDITRYLITSVLGMAGLCEDPGHDGLRAYGVGGAVAEAERLWSRCGDLPACAFMVAMVYDRCDRKANAREIARTVEERAAAGYTSPFMLSRFRVLTGDLGGAVDALERGLEARDPAMLWTTNGLWHETLWGDPGFESIVERLGIPDNRPPRGSRTWH